MPRQRETMGQPALEPRPVGMGARRARRVATLIALAALVASCGPRATEEKETPAEENAIVQEKERGPVKVTLRVEPKELTFAERITFTIAAEATEKVDVTLPDPGVALAGGADAIDPTKFIIRDFINSPPEKTPDGTVIERQSYVLEVVTSGEFTIPELTVSFVDRRENAPLEPPGSDTPAPIPPAKKEGQKEKKKTAGATDTTTPDSAAPEEEKEERVFKIVTDPMKITVKSLEDTAALEDLRPIEGPVEPPVVPPSLKWPLVALGGVVGLVVLVFLAVKLARRPPRAPPPVPPEVIAYRELEWLLEQGFADRGELKEFYFHLSRIVREYIERRFGLRAPERTTEEFLEELARSDVLRSSHTMLLQRFLEKADMVKFARYAPTAEEITASFDAAKEFIEETRAQPEEVASGSR